MLSFLPSGSRTLLLCLYYGSGNDVVAWDLLAQRAHVLATMSGRVEQLAVSTQGVIYVSCGPDVYQLTSTVETTSESAHATLPSDPGQP